MAKRRVYDLCADSTLWILVERGSTGAVRTFRYGKDHAIHWARAFVRARRPSQLVVRNRNGRISFENTYMNDPRRTRG